MATRRAVLLGSTAALALLGGGAALLVRQADAEAFVRAVLGKHVPHVAMSDTDLRALTEDFLEAERPLPGQRLLLDHAGGPLMVGATAQAALPAALRTQAQWLERRVLRHFFLASDFFDDPATPRRVSLVRSADPYTAGCANPFARFEAE